MGLSSAVLFIFISLLIQSRAIPEVKDIKLEYPAVELNLSSFPRQCEDFILCDRVQVSGISRWKLEKFFSDFRVTVVPSVGIPKRLHSKILVCFHRNNALGLCQCKKDEWKAIQKGRWSSIMSPYEDKYVDVKFIDGVKGSAFVTLDEDSQQWRHFFLTFGFVLLLLAPIVSWIPFYYTSSMDIGVFLVILSILFQGMKFLLTGKKKFLYFSIYGSVLGAGSFLLLHFSVLVNSILLHFGMSGEMYNPVSVFLLARIVLSVAVMGSWIVRNADVAPFVKLAMRIIGTTSILELFSQCTLDTPTLGAVVVGWTLFSLIDSLLFGRTRNYTIYFSVEGKSVDVGVAQYVKWAMRIVGTTSIFLCSLDTPLALGAVVACWTVCSLIHSLLSGGVRYQAVATESDSTDENAGGRGRWVSIA